MREVLAPVRTLFGRLSTLHTRPECGPAGIVRSWLHALFQPGLRKLNHNMVHFT
jgi:hypothetical protein